MKLFAAALSFYILFLAVLPTFANMKMSNMKGGCQKTCCPLSKPCENKSNNTKDNGCAKGQCTPFFSCAKMQVIIPVSTALPCKQVLYKHHYVLSFDSYYFTSLSSVWHPPKVA